MMRCPMILASLLSMRWWMRVRAGIIPEEEGGEKGGTGKLDPATRRVSRRRPEEEKEKEEEEEAEERVYLYRGFWS